MKSEYIHLNKRLIQYISLFFVIICSWCELSLSAVVEKKPVECFLSINDAHGSSSVTLHLHIQDGWKVYSHQPGESGLPLNVTFHNIQNINSYEISWPPSELMEESGFKSYIYRGDVSIPIKIIPRDSHQVLAGEIKIEYGACNEYCMRGEDTLEFNISATNPYALWWLILCAIIGGFILNLMPCVLPVLALKLFSLLKNIGNERKKIRFSLILTILGILSSFILLAIITESFKALGHAVGWGFHFQEPGFIMFLIVVLVIFASNLWGTFEINTPQFFYRRTDDTDSYLGSFLSGMFATLLATPCTAPFLSVAVAFGLSQGFYYLLIIYFFVGVGMALPFIILLFNSKLLSILPKPGKWMITLKKTFAILLALTAVWLLYVLSFQLGYKAVLILVGSLLITKFIIALPGFRKYPFLHIISIILLIIGSCLLTLKMEKMELSDQQQGDTVWEEFSEQKLAQYITNKEVVLVDITAEWCLICKLNKLRVWDQNDTTAFLKAHNIKLMRGDYTNRSIEITRYLQANNHLGIPFTILYSQYFPNGLVLPTMLNKPILFEKLDVILISTK